MSVLKWPCKSVVLLVVGLVWLSGGIVLGHGPNADPNGFSARPGSGPNVSPAGANSSLAGEFVLGHGPNADPNGNTLQGT